MGAIALINILDSLMKLGVALYIGHSAFDKLFVYGLLTMSCIVLTLILKRVYCIMHFSESHFRWHKIKDMKLMRSISSFALWNLIGSGCSMARYQGTGMLLNSSFKILINASYGTAQQVNGLLNFFANTIVRAIRPQIVKSEGANNRERMLRLSCTTCKITSLMVALLAVPMYIEMPFILHVWLNKEIPVDTLIFCRYFLVIVFIYQMTIGLQVAIESVGKIKLLQIIVGTMHILALPAGYVCFRLGCPPYSIMLCIVAEEIIALVSRSLICRKLTGLSLKIFYTKTIIPVSLSVILIFLACDTVRNKIFTEGWIEFFSITLLSTTLICLVSYKWILSKEERHTINSLVSKLKNKILKK
jgi:O-antigen/teichoic acid export membrane protein